MASSFRRLRGLPGAELEARSSSPHCALPRTGGSGLVPPRTPQRPPQAASSQLAEGLEASSELRLASLLQLVNPASRTASPAPGPTQEKMPGQEMLEASSNAEGETDDAPAQVAAPLSDAHAQQQHARQVEALVRALRKKPVASTGQCSRRASGDYASADTATLPSCGSKTSENGVQGPETAPTIARHAAAAADEAAEAEEEVEGGVETEEAAVVGRLDNLFATLNRCRASLDAQAQLSTGALETSEQDPGTSSAPSAACSGGGGSGNGGGADILVLWPSDSATPECAAAAPSSSGVSLSEATLDRVKGAPAGLNFDSTHFESHQLASRGCSSRGISSGGSVWIDYEQQRSTTEMLQEAFPAHVALLFASDSWELREMAIDRMETALCEQEPQGESLARPSTANILRSRASLMNGDAETSALEDEQSDEGSSNEGQQPRFWAKAVRVSRASAPSAAAPSDLTSSDTAKSATQSKKDAEASISRDTSSRILAEGKAEPHISQDLQLVAACWMLREALSDSMPQTAQAALAVLSPDGVLLGSLLGRCSARTVRHAVPLLFSPLAQLIGGPSAKIAYAALDAFAALVTRGACDLPLLLPFLLQSPGDDEGAAGIGRLRMLARTCSRHADRSSGALLEKSIAIDSLLTRCTSALRSEEPQARQAAAELVVSIHKLSRSKKALIESWLASQPAMSPELCQDIEERFLAMLSDNCP